MYNKVNLTASRTVDLNGDSIVFVEPRDSFAFVRLCDGSEYLTAEDYEEFVEMFGISASREKLKADMISRAEFLKSISDEVEKERPELASYIRQ